MKKVLFLGDSITDAGRSYDEDVHDYIGQGYTLMAAGVLAMEKPGEYEFTNKGISGNRIVDLYSRIKCDCWNLKPDYISILMGVNDVWHEQECKNGVEEKRFDHMYRTLIEETFERLPDCKIMLMEPFIYPGYTMGTDADMDELRVGVEALAKVVRKIAEDFNLVFIPLQAELDEMAKKYGYKVWAEDGVHPSVEGNALLAKRWLEGFAKLNG